MGWKWNSDKDNNISKIQMKTWVPPLLYAKWHWFWIFDYWYTCSHLRGPLCWRNQTKQPRHLKNLCNSWPTRLQGDYDHWKYSHDRGSPFLNGMDPVWAQVSKYLANVTNIRTLDPGFKNKQWIDVKYCCLNLWGFVNSCLLCIHLLIIIKSSLV